MDRDLFSNFREIVLENARRASAKKISQQEEKTKMLLEEYEKKVYEEEEMLINKAIVNIEEKYRAMTGRAETDSKRELINKRDEMQKEIFDMLISKLSEFSDSEEYKIFLKNRAIEAVKIAGGEDIVAEVRECDVPVLDGIVRECRKSDITYGGARFIIQNKGIIIDNTLLSAAKDVMADFHEIKIS